MGFSGGEGVGAEVVAGGLEGEGVGDFEGGGEVAGVEDGLNSGGGFGKLGEGSGEHGPALGVGDDAESRFGDHS